MQRNAVEKPEDVEKQDAAEKRDEQAELWEKFLEEITKKHLSENDHERKGNLKS